MQKARESFEVGRYTGQSKTGKVVLAELFTGSECGPCLSADYAYDALGDYFSRKELAILVYHLHIPGPDPMTNEDTLVRQKFYGVRSTPTAILEGTEMMRGGGPRLLTKRKFDRYRKGIANKLGEEPIVAIETQVRFDAKVIGLDVSLTARGDLSDSLRLHRALVERVVHYKGGNGVEEHTFVVRRLLPERALQLTDGVQLVHC